MRRFSAFALLFVFTLQSTASAATPGALSLPNVQPLIAALQTTWIFAVFTGQESRYEAMHAPIPERATIKHDGYRPEVSRTRFAQANVRYGSPGNAPRMLRYLPLPKDAPRDPLAMGSDGTQPVQGLPAQPRYVTTTSRVTTSPSTRSIRTGAVQAGIGSRRMTAPTPAPTPTPSPGTLTPNSVTLAPNAVANVVASPGIGPQVQGGVGCAGIATVSGTPSNISVHAGSTLGTCTTEVTWGGPQPVGAPLTITVAVSPSPGTITPSSVAVTTTSSAAISLSPSANEPLPQIENTGCAGIASLAGPGITGVAPGTCTMQLTWSVTPTTYYTGAIQVSVTAATPTPVPTATPVPTPTPIPTLAAASTGVNSWWTYQEKPLAGVGKAMVNVANGNLLVQADDIDVPERGIDLAFRRTYNSQSQHDTVGTDGAPSSIYGNGWTSTFDAHIAYDSVSNVMSVYDLDGARYDFTSNGSGAWAPPAGLQGTTLTWDGQCGYQWTKKNGTTYYFFEPSASPNAASCFPNELGYAGRLTEIIARNHNNMLKFEYSWVGGNASTIENLATITVEHTDGQSLLLTFADFGSNIELASITRPDGLSVTYNYDSSGNLVAVTRPGNATDDASRTATISTLQEQYWYYSGTHELQGVGGPRYVWSGANTPGNPDGSYYQFAYTVNSPQGEATALDDYATVNFTPADGSGGQPLQPGIATGYDEWHTDTLSYASGSTTMTDSDGHSTIWTSDGFGRVTQTQESTGSQWLVTTATWDAGNDLTASTDARGNETNYAYDASGNTIAVAEPTVTTSAGVLRPTATYSYDQYSNLTSYCDAVYNTSNSWNNPSSAPPVCPATGSGVTYYTYDYSDTTNEPFGKLTDTYTPLGYHHHISYDSNDYGLPIEVQGAAYTQDDGTTRTPTQTFAYDSYGNLTSYNKGNGTWTLTYDSLNRNKIRVDPDDVASYTCYNPDGTVLLRRSASQYAADGSALCVNLTPKNSAGVWTAYDPDGNTIIEQHHHGCPQLSGCQAGVTSKWYDGEDRLVEVQQPQDSNDAYAFPWMTRYIYDVTGGGTVSINGGASSFDAHGNLYKTQECIQGTSVTVNGPTASTASPAPPSTTPSAPSYSGGCSFQDLRGNTFDALDRSQTKYEVAAGTTPEQTSIYDGNGQYGLLSGKTNPLYQTDTLSYDADGHLTNEAFSDGVTPNRSFAYDPDGREISLTSATLGTQTKSYDADGHLVQSTDPSSEYDPDTITYSYYGDGLRKSLSLSIPGVGFNQSNLFEYSYRPDGLRSSLVSAIGVGSAGGTFAWTYTSAGRELTQSDPLTGVATTVEGLQNTSYTLVPRTLTYDAYGRISGLTLPRSLNAFGTYTYDLEDKAVSYGVTGGSGLNSSGESASADCCETYQLSTRNETSGMNVAGAKYANGAVCTVPGGPLGNGNSDCTFDARSGQMLEQQLPYSTGGTNTAAESHTYGYDAAGRQINDTLACGSAAQLTATRSYDADNHIIAQAIPAMFTPGLMSGCTSSTVSQQALTYSWGADGRLANFTQETWCCTAGASPTTADLSAHWDGDDLLYVMENGTTSPIFYIEKLAYTSGPAGTMQLAVYDRDQTGTNVNLHFGDATAARFTPLVLENVHPYTPPPHCTASNPIRLTEGICSGTQQKAQAPSAGGPSYGIASVLIPNAILDAKREDGYNDGSVVLQGVRAYDPNMNQWTTPDAYAGDVHDPMSQHPYMWNENNPVQYQDPSGYDASSLVPEPRPNAAPAAPRGPVRANVHEDIYVKVEVSASAGVFTGTLSLGVTTAPGVFLQVGGLAGTGGGASIAGGFGTITPNNGSTTSQVVSGRSEGGSFNWVTGAEKSGNANGTMQGLLVTSGTQVQGGAGGTYGIYLGAPGAKGGSTAQGSTPSKPPSQ